MSSPLEQISKSTQDIFIKSSKPIKKVFDSYIEPVLSQPLIQVLVSWFVILNIIFSLDLIPVQLVLFLKHPVVKVLITFAGLYLSTKQFYLSFATTLGIVALICATNAFSESFELVWPTTDVYPGCTNVKVEDLLALFQGDEGKLKSAMYEGRVPLNVDLTDRNAPVIATYLINLGHKVSEQCSQPL